MNTNNQELAIWEFLLQDAKGQYRIADLDVSMDAVRAFAVVKVLDVEDAEVVMHEEDSPYDYRPPVTFYFKTDKQQRAFFQRHFDMLPSCEAMKPNTFYLVRMYHDGSNHVWCDMAELTDSEALLVHNRIVSLVRKVNSTEQRLAA